jgi:hypothetical protein
VGSSEDAVAGRQQPDCEGVGGSEVEAKEAATKEDGFGGSSRDVAAAGRVRAAA